MYCRNCGKEIDDKAYVCVHCGVLTNNPQARQTVINPAEISQAVTKAKSAFMGNGLYKKFCIAYPFVLLILMIQKLITLEIPALSYFDIDSKFLTLSLYDMYFKIPKLKNSIDDYLYISGGVTIIYVLVLITVAIISITLIIDIISQLKNIFTKNKSNFTPNFIIGIVFSGFFILAPIIIKAIITGQIEEYSGFDAAEVFSIFATPFVWAILIISIIGEFLQNKYKYAPTDHSNDIKSFWTCSYCHYQNEISQSVCSSCNHPKPKM